MDRTIELEEQVHRLTGEFDEMRARLTGEAEEMRARVQRLEGTEPGHQNGKEPRSRRGFLKFGAGAVMGAVGMAAAKVMPAAATAGDTMIIGIPNRSAAPTFLTGDINISPTGPNPVLQVNPQGVDTTSLAATLNGRTLHGALRGFGQAGAFEGVDAWASGTTGTAVFGLSDTGTAIAGETDGVGLYAIRSGRIRQDGQAASGAPTYAPGSFEQVRDANGVLYIHGLTGAGQAKWRRVNSLRFDRADGTGGFFVPFRLVDTRTSPTPFNGPFPGNAVITIPVSTSPNATGASAIPADAVGVVGNLTAVLYTGGGYLTIYPAGAAIPGTSSVNFLGGQAAVANAFAVGIGAGGAISVVVATPSPNTSHFIVDITGYIQ